MKKKGATITHIGNIVFLIALLTLALCAGHFADCSAAAETKSVFKLYTMDNNYFSCEIPADWDLQRDKDKDREYGIYEIELISGSPMTTISVRYFLKDNADFSGYRNFLDRNSRNILGETTSSREKYGPVREISLKGSKAYELRRERMVYLNPATKSDESASIKELLYVLPLQDGSFYVLHFSARSDFFASHLPVFERIVRSFDIRR